MDDIVLTTNRDRDDLEMEDDEIDRLKKSASKRKGRGMNILATFQTTNHVTGSVKIVLVY